ncbi:PREDICTED: uncharacterized protein LOC107189298, partial [Dufourea novaeangliae]|uniref:uncharacterized protein LOC107189298 n=1 Tax=Dufourea novaeangliae TaxID=178035 RepID=UPI000767BBA5
CLLEVKLFSKCLKCRTKSQETDMRYQKVLKTCLKRNAGSRADANDSMSSDSDSSESDSSSEEIVYDKHAFYRNSAGSSNNQSASNQKSRSD